ncbi:MAG TPA: hypothetical protein VLV31_09760 [Candidatus Acidoferrales bacterium]|nr:hypothetical protein [Candidatus Acidoferrales bacterium]
MIDLTKPLNIARFPTRREADIFVRHQAPFIDILRVEDATEFNPQAVNPMPIRVLYQLKRQPMLSASYVLDCYGNSLPNSLWPALLRSRRFWF